MDAIDPSTHSTNAQGRPESIERTTSSGLSKAFRQPRGLTSLPDTMARGVDIDAPLPIGFGQTNSQPYTVRLMLEGYK